MVFRTLVLQFYLKIGQKQKRRYRYISEKKKRTKARQCYHDNICRWNRDGFSSEVEIKRGTAWIKILKKEILRKI